MTWWITRDMVDYLRHGELLVTGWITCDGVDYF